MNPSWAQVKAWIDANISLSPSGCWKWNGALTAAGYGRLWGTSAHRLAYEAYVGPIGRGLDIDHLCRNRACVNPSHLEPVTRAQNLERGEGIARQKQRAAERQTCSRGHLLSEANTYLRPSDGARLCRTCRHDHDIDNRRANRDRINARKRRWRAAKKQSHFEGESHANV